MSEQTKKTCTKCGELKPQDEFIKDKSCKSGRGSLCRKCSMLQRREYRSKNPSADAQYRANNRERVRSSQARWRKANKEKIAERRKANKEKILDYKAAYRASGKESQQQRSYRQKNRLSAIKAYGGRCSCCGEETIEFLSIDHIHNDGAQHRKEISSGSNIYAWLKKNCYPKGRFQLLCHNCNLAKGFYGACPHSRRKEQQAA